MYITLLIIFYITFENAVVGSASETLRGILWEQR